MRSGRPTWSLTHETLRPATTRSSPPAVVASSRPRRLWPMAESPEVATRLRVTQVSTATTAATTATTTARGDRDQVTVVVSASTDSTTPGRPTSAAASRPISSRRRGSANVANRRGSRVWSTPVNSTGTTSQPRVMALPRTTTSERASSTSTNRRATRPATQATVTPRA